MLRFVRAPFKCCNSLIYGLQKYVPGLPVVSFRFSDQIKQKYPDVQQKWMQTLLRAKGWLVSAFNKRIYLASFITSRLIFQSARIVPNYELAPNLENIDILRVVVRENLTEAVRLSSCFALSVIY